MNFKTFFTLLFLISISGCILSTFYSELFKNILQNLNINKDIKFIGLFSLIMAIVSYIGMLITFYRADKKERLRLKKLKEDRMTMEKIHQELESLR